MKGRNNWNIEVILWFKQWMISVWIISLSLGLENIQFVQQLYWATIVANSVLTQRGISRPEEFIMSLVRKIIIIIISVAKESREILNRFREIEASLI